MLHLHIVSIMLVAGAAQAAPAARSSSNDACRLLTFDDVREVQKVAVRETKPSERRTSEQRHATCVFATEDVVHSVSVTLTTATERLESLDEYWTRTFKRDRKGEGPAGSAPKRSELPLHRLEALGSDAVWTGDSKTGSLYVLVPGAILRVSVGGVADVTERLHRSRELTRRALARLPRQPRPSGRKIISYR